MLGLLLVAAWMTFVAGYLIWQQVTGDLADHAIIRPVAAGIRKQPAAVSMAAREDPRDVRRSLVYRPTGFQVAAGRVRAES